MMTHIVNNIEELIEAIAEIAERRREEERDGLS